jgi:hypothetical protein
MLSQSEKEALNKGMIIMWILWSALVVSLFIYVLICHLAQYRPGNIFNAVISLENFKNILYIVSIITLIISYFVRKAALVVRSSSTRPLASNTSIIPAITGKYTVAMITALAFSESIGIYGLVLFFMGDSFQTLHTFIGVAVLAMFFYRPKREEIETLANDMKMKSTQSEVP